MSDRKFFLTTLEIAVVTEGQPFRPQGISDLITAASTKNFLDTVEVAETQEMTEGEYADWLISVGSDPTTLGIKSSTPDSRV
jgi:hypothetical protein